MTESREIKHVNVSRFLAEALEAELGTFTEDSDVDPELIEGVVEVELLDFDALLSHLNQNYETSEESTEELNSFKKHIEGEVKVFAYWEA